MSDERPPQIDDDKVEPLPRGAALLAQAALRSPDPPAHAEAAAQERALSAYQDSVVTPRPLHAEPWRAGDALGLAGRLKRLVRRLRGD